MPGDCRDVMLDMLLDGERFEAVITDPPYELTSIKDRFGKPGSAPAQGGVFARSAGGFMGKQWDATGISYDAAMWRQCYDLMLPGAHIAAFGGTRTYHRIACALEDAGFELRDTLMWIYGTGFPKSHDVSKGIDRTLGAEREVVATGPTRASGMRGGSYIGGDGKPETRTMTAPGSPEAAAWQGWGTALKPAYEPIILARKPLDGTVAQTVLAHGCGAINVSACRVTDGTEVGGDRPPYEPNHGNDVYGEGMGGGAWSNTSGRWPANVVHDGSPEVLEAFARFGESSEKARLVSRNGARASDGWGLAAKSTGVVYGDAGSAARFFPCCPFGDDDLRFHYSGKARKAERWSHCAACGVSFPARDRDAHKDHGDITSHPTVKPLALMRWLATLLTRPGGRILDPFAGTGSTLQAASMAGFRSVGIERDPDYQADIAARLAAYSLEN